MRIITILFLLHFDEVNNKFSSKKKKKNKKKKKTKYKIFNVVIIKNKNYKIYYMYK